YFDLTVGVPAPGTIATHQNAKLDVTVSDFGLFGFAPGSLYNLAADGFRFNGSENLLYESGLIVGRSALQMSSSIRDENGIFKPSDFNPTVSLSSSTISASGEESRTAVFDDSQSAIAIPIEITQKTITSNQIGEEGLLIVEYSLHNNSVETITDLHLGLLHDFDLSDNDQLEYDPSLSLIYQQNNSDMFVGVVALKNLSSFKMFENLSGKKGFTNSELLTIMSDTANDIRDTITGDLMFMTSTNKFSLTSNESFDVAYAYVCGNTLNELYDNAVIAKQKYDITTDLNDNTLSLPKQFELFQNYPNPFNPTTKIQFNLAATSEIKLEVYNVLGQKVKTIADTKLSAGVHEYQWDATDDANQSVASGIYFYRLSNDEQFKTHKMTLLK
ncbi:MAG TPA: T9SS type A sorting domain-containing protein, partial [candidate division Zixibacteria bacterium]|nr:T9SS type A sorting domain-containing protein [candidate division Zixibacteria bacterium]